MLTALLALDAALKNLKNTQRSGIINKLEICDHQIKKAESKSLSGILGKSLYVISHNRDIMSTGQQSPAPPEIMDTGLNNSTAIM